EVRREVFAFLLQQKIKFFALVRDKRVIVQKIADRQLIKPTYKYHQNQLYDRCVSRLFRDRLHKDDSYAIHFARRGSSDRTGALLNALMASRANFQRTYGIESTAPIEINASEPTTTVNLQVADYYLWALQRMYERHEERYLHLVWKQVGLIHDVDDTREAEYGVYYSKKRQLSSDQLP
ncbi:MAG: hypothetical protein ABI557_11310, partial [Aureliella sp.]